MPSKKDPTSSTTQNVSTDNNIVISGDVNGVVVVGNENTVNQTIIQKFFNIFKSDSETLEHRNRRILLGHVENAWIKGVLDASLHGAALLDLGIKQDPEAVTKYPWAIKKELTDETLPAGTSMLEIFDSIGMGRSLLILGTPGSGKTTMLLELARQLIGHAREDVTYPIPMVFNLASWTEKLSLADWLAQELNNLYSVPRKTAPDWVKGDKLLLLLDGLDEVRQESRTKCVEAINAFRKEHGLTSLAVCSRSQDYADLNAKLSFEGAIEVQPLTQEQIHEFFNRFGDEMAGIKQVLKKDSTLREMAETPLFLSVMIMAYRDKQDVDIQVSQDEKVQRKQLFDTYIKRMFERRSENVAFKKQHALHWLSRLAARMLVHNTIPYMLEDMQPEWLGEEKQIQRYNLICALFIGLLGEVSIGLPFGLLSGRVVGLLIGLPFGLLSGSIFWMSSTQPSEKIFTVDSVSWNWNNAKEGFIYNLKFGMIRFGLFGGIGGLIFGLIFGLLGWWIDNLIFGLLGRLIGGLIFGVIMGLIFKLVSGLIDGLLDGLSAQQVDQTTYPGQKLVFTAKNFFFTLLLFWLFFWLFFGLILGLVYCMFFGLSIGISIGLTLGTIGVLRAGLIGGLLGGLIFGLIFGLAFGGLGLVQHYALRFTLSRNNLLPWRLVPFLDRCVDLIFLRRVGGGYIFVHRLLMEHFADMYVETPTSKGN